MRDIMERVYDSEATQEPMWLTSSCFLVMQRWHPLLQACRDFILSLPDGDSLSYRLTFDDANGDHIQLAVLTTHERIDSLGQRMDHYFTDFFELHRDTDVMSPVNDIYLPFPTNTIQFGLYRAVYDQSLVSTVYKLQRDFSDIIVAALSGEEINYETLVTFSFYLQIGLTKACLKYHDDVPAFLRLLSEILPQANAVGSSMANMADENLRMMQEITSEVMDNEYFEGDMSWFNRWIDISKERLQCYHTEDVSAVPGKVLHKFYTDSISIVYAQLNIKDERQNLIDFLVSRCLKEYYK